MKDQDSEKNDYSGDAFMREVGKLWPLAKGSVSIVNKRCCRKGCKACESGVGHPAAIYTYRTGGKLRCMHVRKGFVPELRRAIENGRKLEELLVRAGRELVLKSRREDG